MLRKQPRKPCLLSIKRGCSSGIRIITTVGGVKMADITGAILQVSPKKWTIGDPLSISVKYKVMVDSWESWISVVRVSDGNNEYMASTQEGDTGWSDIAPEYIAGVDLGYVMPDTPLSFSIELWGGTGPALTKEPNNLLAQVTLTVQPTTEDIKPPLQQFQDYIPWIIGGVAVLGVGYVAYKGFGRK
jgi:hypothetical protein